jgi:DNA-directed RNA polymerase specialized sigma subunit
MVALSTRRTYRATVQRQGAWWAIIAEQVDRHGPVASQSRRLDQAEPMIRDAIALTLDVDPDSFDVELDIELPDELSEQAREAIRLRQQIADAHTRLDEIELAAVEELRQRLSVRDVAELFRITPSRVSQIHKHHATR